MEEAAAHNGSAAAAGTPAAPRPPATPEGMALAYGSLVLMALLPIFFGALRSVSCAKSKVPPRARGCPAEPPPGAARPLRKPSRSPAGPSGPPDLQSLSSPWGVPAHSRPPALARHTPGSRWRQDPPPGDVWLPAGSSAALLSPSPSIQVLHLLLEPWHGWAWKVP